MIDLTSDDLEQIAGWYESASGETATRVDDPENCRDLMALLKKLGIEPTFMDIEFCKKQGIDPWTEVR